MDSIDLLKKNGVILPRILCADILWHNPLHLRCESKILSWKGKNLKTEVTWILKTISKGKSYISTPKCPDGGDFLITHKYWQEVNKT